MQVRKDGRKEVMEGKDGCMEGRNEGGKLKIGGTGPVEIRFRRDECPVPPLILSLDGLSLLYRSFDVGGDFPLAIGICFGFLPH